jgi:putative oxidoreductase
VARATTRETLGGSAADALSDLLERARRNWVAIVNDKLQTLIFPAVSHPRLSWALLILRLFVGVAFIQHGSGKLMHPAEFAAEFGIPVWLGLATMLTQLIGGILLIIGALTPLAALGIAGTMIIATVFLINSGEPFINPAGHSWENSAFYLTAGICLALSGAGPWSLDAWLFARRSNNPAVDVNRAARSPTSG